jgi:diguanylate cyclase (GGDEF)-like protein/PAS domain S-box-containing protein
MAAAVPGLVGPAAAPALGASIGTAALIGIASLGLLLAFLVRSVMRVKRIAALHERNSRDIIARLDAHGRITYAPPATATMLGYPSRTLLHQPLAALCHPEDAPALTALLAAAPRRCGHADRLFRLRHADGHFMPIELTLAPGDAGGSVCVLRDVTRWQAAVAEAKRTEERYHLLAEHAGDVIARVRPDRTRAYISPAAKAVLGYTPDELRGLDFLDIVHPDDRQRTADVFAACVRDNGQATLRCRLRHPARGTIWVEASWAAQPPEAPGRPGDVVSVVRDISERIAAEQQVAFLARHDPLTGLANRALLQERTEQALAAASRGGLVAMLCFDLDLFRKANDSFGHDAGDRLLREIAERIVTCIRPADTLARLDGDAFAVLQAGIDRTDDAGRLATRLLSTVATPFTLAGQTVSVSASLGIAIAPADGSDYPSLLRKANAALRRAKTDGRSRWRFFEPAMEAERAARERLVIELRQALARGEFVLHYMPTVRLADERITGFEALLRWRHPRRGLLGPGAFIGLAEETGLMVPIGTWVMSQACADAARWPEPVPVAVNLSPVQLRDGTLPRSVAAALRAAGLPAARLALEVTESALLGDNAALLAELHALQATGVRIALDDFGTGYASLRSLRQFPFDKIKLDRTFVRDVAEDADARAIVRAVAGLGRSLGIATVAEGVETPIQSDLLRAEGYIEAQGLHFGAAVDRDGVMGLLGSALREAAPLTC